MHVCPLLTHLLSVTAFPSSVLLGHALYLFSVIRLALEADPSPGAPAKLLLWHSLHNQRQAHMSGDLEALTPGCLEYPVYVMAAVQQLCQAWPQWTPVHKLRLDDAEERGPFVEGLAEEGLVQVKAASTAVPPDAAASSDGHSDGDDDNDADDQ